MSRFKSKYERMEELRKHLNLPPFTAEKRAAYLWLDSATYGAIDLDDVGLAMLNAEDVLRRAHEQ